VKPLLNTAGRLLEPHTQATSGDLSHPHSTTTTKTGRTRPNQDPNDRRETSRLGRAQILSGVYRSSSVMG
jgi:hypothetical protein